MKDDIEAADLVDLTNAKPTSKPNLLELNEFIKRNHPRKANGEMNSRRETISLPTGNHACICGESS